VRALPGAWWLAVAVYTALLPGAIAVWNLLAAALGQRSAGWVPAAIVALAAAGLVYHGRRRQLSAERWTLLAAGGALAAALLLTAELPSKRIHVPEYMLLAWLLHRALGARGATVHEGVWVSVLGLALGAVDETLQGLIPTRFFALRDIVVNGGAAAAGALAVAAFAGTHRAPRSWSTPHALLAGGGLLAAAVALLLVQRNLWRGLDGLTAPLPVASPLLCAAAGAAAVVLWRTPADTPARALATTSVVVLALLTGGAWLGVPFK